MWTLQRRKTQMVNIKDDNWYTKAWLLMLQINWTYGHYFVDINISRWIKAALSNVTYILDTNVLSSSSKPKCSLLVDAHVWLIKAKVWHGTSISNYMPSKKNSKINKNVRFDLWNSFFPRSAIHKNEIHDYMSTKSTFAKVCPQNNT